VRTEAALFVARTDEMNSEIEVLETQRIQRQTELEEGRVEVSAAQRSLALIQEEIRIIEPLVQRRIEPETSLLSLRRSLAEAESRAVQARSAITRFEAALKEIDDRILSTRSRYRSEAQSELAITTAELTELRTRIPALEERVNRTELRAPVRGVVNTINVSSIGSVAQAGATLVEIVPIDDTLLVEAYLRPNDIAFIHPDQEVKINITAYDFSRYGSIEGQITRIGSDTIPHPQTDEQVFVVDVRANTNILDGAGEPVEIIPGMVAQIDILAGRKTVLDYVTEPVVRVRETAFRD
jgi:adhesin transport system membrane fusion protein